MNLTLRAPTSADIPDLVELDRACFQGWWSAASYAQELGRPSSVILGLWADHLLALGCLWLILEEAHVILLAVHPQQRRQRLGQLLLGVLLHHATTRGATRATLEVRASNAAALALYTQFEFQTAGRRRDYYQNPREDGLVLWHNGLGTPSYRQVLDQFIGQAQAHLTTLGYSLEPDHAR